MKSLELMILVGLLVTLGGATQVTQGGLMKRAPCLDGYKFTEGILWDAPAPSAGICSALCVRHHSCVSFTFDGSTCIGHSVTLTSVSPSATPSAGARTFVKTEAVQSYVLEVQSNGDYGSYELVQFPPNVNLSAMSKICFSIPVCGSVGLSFTGHPWRNSTQRLDAVIYCNSPHGYAYVQSPSSTIEWEVGNFEIPTLNCTEYQKFYMKWEEKAIEVGLRSRGNSGEQSEDCLVDKPIVNNTNLQPFSINSLFLTRYSYRFVPTWILQGCLD